MYQKILAGLILFATLACTTKKCEQVPGGEVVCGTNLVDGVDPRWDDLHKRAATTLIALRQMPVTEHQAYLKKNWPTLENDIVAQMRMANRLPARTIDSVVFHFGSGQGVRADDRTAERHDGFFSNELVAYVHAKNDTTKVLVRCLNGLFVIDGSKLDLERAYSAEPTMQFTVDRRRGLTTYVDYATSIDLAERFSLPLYRGRRQIDERRITPREARALADSTNFVQVTVRVFEGDQFDLGAMTYKPNRGEVRYASR